jgi:hypothetical protein
MVLPCGSSYYGAEGSVWSSVSGLGYCWKLLLLRPLSSNSSVSRLSTSSSQSFPLTPPPISNLFYEEEVKVLLRRKEEKLALYAFEVRRGR